MVFDIQSTQEKIIKAKCFEDARIIFDDYLFSQTELNKYELLKLLEYLQCKVETPTDVYIVKDYYIQLQELEPLSKFLKTCAFQDDDQVKNMRISVEKLLGNYSTAEKLCDNLKSDNNYNNIQRASLLNRRNQLEEARELIERVMLNKGITKYSIKVYASIINNLTKQDVYAINLCIPSLARNICKYDEINSFSLIRLLAKILDYENNLGNKKEFKRTCAILKYYSYLIGKA